MNKIKEIYLSGYDAGYSDGQDYNCASYDLEGSWEEFEKEFGSVVKTLEWDTSRMEQGFPARAESILGDYTAWVIQDTACYQPPTKAFGGGIICGKTLEDAFAAAQTHFNGVIQKALA